MATLREIKQRIKGIKNTQQITKAMKMVAAAKLRRAQERALKARPYASGINDLVRNLVASAEDIQIPLLQKRPVRRTSLVVITSDRGLCGGFNSHIIKMALNEFSARKDQEISLTHVGRKGYDFFNKRNYSIAAKYINILTDLEYRHADQIAEFLIEEFLAERTDAIRLVYNQFKSVAQQTLVAEDLLPIRIDDSEDVRPADYLFEPSQEAILRELLPRHIKMQIWQALLESFASEQAARMVAMENATDNANDLIRDLTLQFNKARQAAITTEISEIVGGAEALKGAS